MNQFNLTISAENKKLVYWAFRPVLEKKISVSHSNVQMIFSAKSSLGFRGTLSRVVKFQNTEVNIMQGCIVNGENKRSFHNHILIFSFSVQVCICIYLDF